MTTDIAHLTFLKKYKNYKIYFDPRSDKFCILGSEGDIICSANSYVSLIKAFRKSAVSKLGRSDLTGKTVVFKNPEHSPAINESVPIWIVGTLTGHCVESYGASRFEVAIADKRQSLGEHQFYFGDQALADEFCLLNEACYAANKRLQERLKVAKTVKVLISHLSPQQ